MNLFTCEHPKVITNPYTNERIGVSCGECATCRNIKSFKWVQRLEMERACHPYCVFFTLTYSDKYVPKVYFDKDSGYFLDDFGCILFHLTDKEQHIPTWKFDNKDWTYLYNRDVLYVHRLSDVSDFIKRLRSRVKSHEQNPYKSQIRSFVVSEYGCTTFRPHYHGILFFESTWLAENASKVISSCWSTDNRAKDSEPFGLVDVQHVSSSASSYVAQYLNCTTYLPKVYLCKSWRPKHLSSKRPPLGSLSIKSKEIQEVFNKCSPLITLYRRSNNTFADVPLPSSLENRLFPKLKGFDRIPLSLRTSLYRLIEDKDVNCYDDFLDLTECYARHHPDSGLRQYLCKVACVPSAMSRLYSVCRRVIYQSIIFGISVSDYIEHIYRYYDNKEKLLLKSQLRLEECYTKDSSNNVNDLNYLDLVLCNDFKEMLLEDFERRCPYPVFILPELDTIPAYKKMVSTSAKIFKDNTKSKRKNEYLESHRYSDINNLILKIYG